MIVFFITQKQYQWFLYYLLLIFDIHSFIKIHSFIYSSAIRLMKLCAFLFFVFVFLFVYFLFINFISLHFIWNFHLSLKKFFFLFTLTTEWMSHWISHMTFWSLFLGIKQTQKQIQFWSFDFPLRRLHKNWIPCLWIEFPVYELNSPMKLMK